MGEIKLDIIVIGAGLAGLAAAIGCALAGHTVSILEATQELAEIGAGIKLTPNATRLFQLWGIDPYLSSPCEPQTCSIYNYKGELLTYDGNFATKMRQEFGAPSLDFHRVDLHRCLLKRAQDLGVKILLGHTVRDLTHANYETPVGVLCNNGETYWCHLVIGADGLWSQCRSILLEKPIADPPEPTGDLAFRIVLPIEQISDPELRNMVQKCELQTWMGPDSHAVAYSLKGGTLLNLVLLRPDDLPENVSKMDADLEEMWELFEGWDPRLRRLLTYATEVRKWKLLHRPHLDTIINKRRTLVLIGDAAHPMLPYLAQGACSAFEDGAILGLILSHVNFKSDVSTRLELFEEMRLKRTKDIAHATMLQRHLLHFPDGPYQQRREELFRKGAEHLEEWELFPAKWLCRTTRKWLYGYDAVKHVEEAVSKSPLNVVASTEHPVTGPQRTQ
ncbi:FAD/NAD(P)-binding domain-containing protein [Sporormia fimetaria CBS 119925]|uniref:FAD/NAD(P)-binding domain-containing protein n=1 Tax=Sporormia fimetaria CBS 119925 TaxID=1340428 RepID=A0A6A6VD78_9PLEO|nr:FAD/NAD(P)-binding domain-containing protein [Sporormia fimetaria CBS 119925]